MRQQLEEGGREGYGLCEVVREEVGVMVTVVSFKFEPPRGMRPDGCAVRVR